MVIGPCLKMGGMERASVNYANSIQSLGYNVTYVAIFKHERFFSLKDGVKFIEPENFNVEKLSLFKTIRWIRTIIKVQKPDSIFVLNKLYSAIVLLSSLFIKCRVIISERSSPLFNWKWHLELFNRMCFTIRPPDGIVAQTTIAACKQKKYYKRDTPIIVIPNAVKHVELFPKIVRKPIVIAVGRLNDPLKGFDLLIQAFAKVENKDWILQFVGGAKESSSVLTKHIDDLAIVDRVKFVDAAKNIDLLFAEASIFVIPSRSEGFPNAMLEAMAAGLCVVSFDFIAGPSDIITTDYNGIIVQNGNINELAKVIDTLIIDESKRQFLGSNAMDVRTKYSESEIARQLIKFILNPK